MHASTERDILTPHLGLPGRGTPSPRPLPGGPPPGIVVPLRKPIVVIADDHGPSRDVLAGLIASLDADIEVAEDGAEALAAVLRTDPDLVVTDVRMPRLDGITLTERLREGADDGLVPIIVVTASTDRAVRLSAIRAGADGFYVKPFDLEEFVGRAAALLRSRAAIRRLEPAPGVVGALARVAESRHDGTLHAQRVGAYAREIGRAYGIPESEDLDFLYWGGLLHDLGKTAVPDDVIQKPRPLTSAEWSTMRSHPIAGEVVCRSLRAAAHCSPIVRSHHERWDGRGYPDRLAGTRIPMGARIVAVADAWDAMTTDRPYRRAMQEDEALRRLHAGAGSQWDPQFVEIFATLRSGSGISLA